MVATRSARFSRCVLRCQGSRSPSTALMLRAACSIPPIQTPDPSKNGPSSSRYPTVNHFRPKPIGGEGTDLTTTFTGEGQVAVFVAVDHDSAECVGIHAARRATRFEALEPLRQGGRRCFGGFAPGIGRGLSIRHDHGSQYMSDAFQQELAFLGIESSPAFVRAPEGNGCAERFIRTLKENLLWV